MDRIQAALGRMEGFDLSGYRPSYVSRRVALRQAATGEAAEAYVRRVETEAEERRQLVEALGVNVTSFFRDSTVWVFLEEVALPPLVDEKAGRKEAVRVLSLGCAGGQEAYSAAMLLAELSGGDLGRFEVEAWDMDPAALEVARDAWYPAAAFEKLSKPALERYFAREGAGYRVRDPLRRRVRVRRHDMLTQPIEGAFDVVLLRNVVIYFEQRAKEDLFRRVHASLERRGILVLGQAETLVGGANDLFRPLSLRNRVYARLEP